VSELTLVIADESFPLKVFQSEDARHPEVEVFATAQEMFGVAPPELAIGALPVTLVTPPPPPPLSGPPPEANTIAEQNNIEKI
jgi:hypothetical protein